MKKHHKERVQGLQWSLTECIKVHLKQEENTSDLKQMPKRTLKKFRKSSGVGDL